MSTSNTVVQYTFNNNVVKVVKEKYFTDTGRQKIDYCFVFTNTNTLNITTLTRHKTVLGALRKFNKAVKAINEGTKIK
jgi:hypothetical protein